MSTHAPAVINSVDSDSLIILKDDEIITAPDETYGKDVNTILREVMEVSERPHDVKQLFGEFYELLDADDYAGAEKKLNRLEELLGNNDGEVNACRVRLELDHHIIANKSCRRQRTKRISGISPITGCFI